MATVPASLSTAPQTSNVSLKAGGAVVLALRLAAAGAMFGLHIVLARTLGVGGYGVYAFAIAWMQGMAVFGRAGLESTSLRQIAEYRVREEKAKLAGFLRWSRRVNLSFSLLSAVVLAALAIFVVGPTGSTTRAAMLLGTAAIPLMTSRQVQEARLRAVHHVWQSLIGPALWPALMALFLFVGVSRFGWNASPHGAIGLQVAALLVCSLLTLTFVRRSPLAEISHADASSSVSIWRRTAFTFLAFETVILLRGRTSVVIAGMMIDTDTAGIFGAAERFADVVTLGVVSINMFAAPHFASLHASGQKEELRSLVRSSQSLGLLFAVPVASVVVVFGRPLLELLSEGFAEGYPLMVIMLASVTIGALAGPAAYVLSMSGRERVVLHGAMLCMVVNLVLSFALAAFYGATGLAITHLATMVVWTAYMLRHLRRFLAD